VLYFAADYLARSFIKLLNILIIIMLVLFLVVGLYAIIMIITTNYQNINDLWLVLSPLSRINYYKNDITYLSYIYYWKMIITGILYISLAVTGTLAMVFSYQLFFAINDQWRPKMRSKLKDETALRYIDFYKKFNKDYKILSELKDDQIPLNREDEGNKLLLHEDNNKDLGIGIIREEDPKENIKPIEPDHHNIIDNNNNLPVSNNELPDQNAHHIRDNYASNIPLNEDQIAEAEAGGDNLENQPEEGNNEEGPKRRKIRRLKK
jgi:hypothetical protein